MSFYFRMPPQTDLTTDQKAILAETDAIAVAGGPGTGKSVVALWRHIRNHERGVRKSLLLTYTKSLEAYLRSSALTLSQKAGEHVDRTYWWTTHHAKNSQDSYDEIIVDEAQDVEIERYETLRLCAKMLSYSADDNQMLYPSRGASQEKLANLFPSNSDYTLQSNYRNTKEISRFIKAMYPSRLISEGRDSGIRPILVASDNNHDLQLKIVIDIIKRFPEETHNIVILQPTVGLVDMWYEKLRQSGVQCSKFTSRDGSLGLIEKLHVTTYKSSKGLEFDTVIVTDANCYDYNLEGQNAVEENDYYVVFTRAKRNLFLIDNGSLVNGAINLPAFDKAINAQLLEVDYSYVGTGASVNTNYTSKPSFNELDADDLPF